MLRQTTLKLWGTPKMLLPELSPQQRRLMEKFKDRLFFRGLEDFADRDCWMPLKKQMDLININLQLVNFMSIFNSNFANNKDIENFGKFISRTITSEPFFINHLKKLNLEYVCLSSMLNSKDIWATV